MCPWWVLWGDCANTQHNPSHNPVYVSNSFCTKLWDLYIFFFPQQLQTFVGLWSFGAIRVPSKGSEWRISQKVKSLHITACFQWKEPCFWPRDDKGARQKWKRSAHLFLALVKAVEDRWLWRKHLNLILTMLVIFPNAEHVDHVFVSQNITTSF